MLTWVVTMRRLAGELVLSHVYSHMYAQGSVSLGREQNRNTRPLSQCLNGETRSLFSHTEDVKVSNGSACLRG